MKCLRALIALGLAVVPGSCLSMSIYNTSLTPVQVVAESSGELTFNVHLYILIDAGDSTEVAQGGAFWRWGDEGPWLPSPAVLYDEHQVDPVTLGSTRRGYNIAWSQAFSGSHPPASTMSFRVWAVARNNSKPVEETASAPVVQVPLLPFEPTGDALDVLLFKAVAFSAGPRDGVHVHLVINICPPQQPTPPDYQLFTEMRVGKGVWTATDAPSRFEHTYDQPVNSKKFCSRYNLSWRPSPGATAGAECAHRADGSPAEPTSLSFRVKAVDVARGVTGTLLISDIPLVCVSKEAPQLPIIVA